jgi:hypothetical protein
MELTGKLAKNFPHDTINHPPSKEAKMSLQLAAQHLSSQGRGNDSTLVHMSPREIKSLNDLAMAHGGQLTINPQTGLPEAGFLESILPMVAGFALNAAVPGLGAAMGGFAIPALVGGGVALMSGSLQKGLMAGLGAYGGANFGEALATQGMQAAAGPEAAATFMGPPTEQTISSLGQQKAAYDTGTMFDRMSTSAKGLGTLGQEGGFSNLYQNLGGSPMSLLKTVGSAAAPLLGGEEVKANMPKTTTQPGKIRTFSYNPYGQNYTSTGDYEVPVTAADGGLMGMYDGYNPNQLDFTQRSEPVVRMADGGTPPPPQNVEDLYTGILGRPSDAGGAAYWQNRFGDTLDPDEINTFTQSANVELANRPAATTAAAPTTAGQTPPPSAPAPAAAAPISAGIEDLYTNVLGRASDPGGAAYWQKQFGDTVDETERNTFMQAAKPEQQVADMYRNVLGRDPDPGGLTYWTTRINKGEPVSNVYNEFLGAARENKEMVTADQNKNATFEQATTPYTGYRSTSQTNIVDEWVRNNLGREPTAEDKKQTWYKDAFNTMNTVPEAKNLYGQFQDYAKADRIKDATASLTARGVTEADVLRQTGKTIAELVASDIDPTNLIGASQLRAPGAKTGFDFSGIRKPTTPQTNAPAGTTNPYGNATNPGDITRNADGSTTITPNIPGRPYGGFSGMEQVRNAYTDGGGSLGYEPKTPKTMDEFNQFYNKQTGGSKQAYDYLTGKADYSATPFTPTGELMKPYTESVMGVPENTAFKKVLFDPATKKYKTNPDYVPITYTDKGEKVYGLSNNEIIKRSTAGEDFAKSSGVTYEQISKALNISIDEAKKRYPGLAASTTASTVVEPEPFVYTGVGPGYRGTNRAAGGLMDAYAGGGMSHLGDYSDGGRLLRGPGDGVSDSIPATIGNKQPARLADGEFVVPARIVSELGNGSTEAGARKLYAMMDRIQSARGKTVGKGKVAKNSRSEKYLPA